MENFDPMAIIESGVEQMTAAAETFATGSNATKESQTGQKGLDYSDLEEQPVIWQPVQQPLMNKIDVIPFIVTEEWYENLLTFPPTQEQRAAGMAYAVKRGIKLKNGGAIDYFLEIPFHRYATGQSGDVVCLREAFGLPCPYCDRMFEEYKKRNDGDPEAEERARSLKPSWRTWANVYNYMYEHTPGAPENHEGYEIIDDYGRGSLLSNIYKASMNAGVGSGFLSNWSHPREGCSLTFDTVYKPPTSKKYKNGHNEFPIIKFIPREPADVDYTDDIVESVRFDKLVSKLIYKEHEMVDMLRMKMKEGPVEKTGQMENSEIGSNAENEVPANTAGISGNENNDSNENIDNAGTAAGTDSNGSDGTEDDTPIINQIASESSRSRGAGRGSRRTPTEIRNDAENSAGTAGTAGAEGPQKPSQSRRRRR